MTVIWTWLVGLLTEILKKFQGLAQITAFLNIPKGCTTTTTTTTTSTNTSTTTDTTTSNYQWYSENTKDNSEIF